MGGNGGGCAGVRGEGQSFFTGHGESVNGYDAQIGAGEDQSGGISCDCRGERLYQGEFQCAGACLVPGRGGVSGGDVGGRSGSAVRVAAKIFSVGNALSGLAFSGFWGEDDKNYLAGRIPPLSLPPA